MDKKILSIFSLLIIFISATILFISFNQSSVDNNQQDLTSKDDLSEGDIQEEIEKLFLPEDDEIDIGEPI